MSAGRSRAIRNLMPRGPILMPQIMGLKPYDRGSIVGPFSSKNHPKCASPQLVPATSVGTVPEDLVSLYVTLDLGSPPVEFQPHMIAGRPPGLEVRGSLWAALVRQTRRVSTFARWRARMGDRA